MNIKKMILSFTTLAILVGMTSCKVEREKIVRDVIVETYDNEDYEKIAHINFSMSLDNAQLPSAVYELRDDLGTISMKYTMDGHNMVDLALNLSKVAKLQPGEAVLPNGQELPIYSQDGVIQIDIPNVKGSIYFATNMERTVMGYGMSINALDGLGNALKSRIGFFPAFFINKVHVIAGLFADPEPGNTGLAAFVGVDWVNARDLGVEDQYQYFSESDNELYFKEYKYSKKFLRKLNRTYKKFMKDYSEEEPIILK